MTPSGPPARNLAGTAWAADGLPIRYEAAGAGPVALVFVHGWCCNRTHWRTQVGAFASDYRTVALDLGGHGESGLGRARWSAKAAAGDILAVIDALGLEQVILIGHSMGGYVSAFAAWERPEAVLGLVGVDTYRQLDQPVTAERIAPFRQDFGQAMTRTVRRLCRADASPDLVARVAGDMGAANPDVGVGLMAASLSEVEIVKDVLRRLPHTIVTLNAPDTPGSRAAAAGLGVKMIELPWAGHFPMLEAPEAFDAQLTGVLDEIVGASCGGP